MTWPPVFHQDVQDQIDLKLAITDASGTYALIPDRAALEGDLRRKQLLARQPVTGATLVASAASAATGLGGGTTLDAITNTGTGAVNTVFRFLRAVPAQMNTSLFTNEQVVSSGIQTYKGALDMLIEFEHEGATTVELLFQGGVASKIRVLLDGQPVGSPDPASSPADGGSFYYYTLTLPSTRRYLVSVEIGASFRFHGVRRDAAATITHPQDTYGGPLIVIGDSYTEGTGADARFSGYATEAGRLLGLRHVVSSGAGGTGYLTVNGDASFPYPKYRNRVTSDVAPFVTADATILVTGGNNDQGYTAAQVTTEASLLFAALLALNPRRVLVLAPFAPSGSVGAGALTTVRDGVVAAAAASGVTVIADPQPDAESWITGTGHVGGTTGSGNADQFIGSDGVHPTQRGHDYLAVKTAAALRAAGI